jgi:hypothetical protein
MTKTEHYQEAIKVAEDAVKNISDPQLKMTAFKVLMEDFLKSKQENQLSTTTSNDKKEMVSIKAETNDDITNQFKKKLANSLKVGSGNLDFVYNIKDDGSFSIICDFGHDLGKSSQIQYVLLCLLANYHLTGERTIFSSQVLKKMKQFGFAELPNLNVYLRSIRPALVHLNVKKQKSDNKMEITALGIKKAEEFFNDIIKNNGIVDKKLVSFNQGIKQFRKRSNLSLHINELISSGFFDEPKPINELKTKLEEKGIFYARAIIDEKIRRGFLGKELTRIKQNKIWQYVVKK